MLLSTESIEPYLFGEAAVGVAQAVHEPVVALQEPVPILRLGDVAAVLQIRPHLVLVGSVRCVFPDDNA